MLLFIQEEGSHQTFSFDFYVSLQFSFTISTVAIPLSCYFS